MPTTKKAHTIPTQKRKKRLPPVVGVTNTFIPAAQNPFTEKLKKAEDILSKTKFMDR